MKARIITLLIAITALLGSATAQETVQKRVMNLYQGGEVIQEYNVGDVDSIKFELKFPKYRIKNVASGKYMNAANYNSHADGTVGGVNCTDYAESDDQIFTFTKSGSNYLLTTLSGYNIVCQSWNVDALKTSGTALTFVDNGDGTYCIKNGSKYFKIELVNGTYYPYCDAGYSQRATWKLEEVGANNAGGDAASDYTVSVTSTAGGIAKATLNSLLQGATFTLKGTPNEGCEFVNWTVNGEVVSTSATYIVAVTSDIEYKANFKEKEENGHSYVDLGLPSGLKWATCNVGANAPEEYGDYFAWGETSPNSIYSGNLSTLPLTADAARVNWGGNWRMPTKAEQDELSDTNNCTWTWTTQNGVNGYKVRSKKNGNSIFLPAAGSRSGDDLYSEGRYGYYWSSSLNTSYNSEAYELFFKSTAVSCEDHARGYRESVRAVCEPSTPAPTPIVCTVSVSTNTGGTATASANSVGQGGSVTLTATPNEGYVFVNWTVNGEVVSTSNPYTATITANSEFVANFEKIEWFRLKNVNNGYYLSFTNHDSYTTNSRDNAGMGVVAYAESSEDQLFRFEGGDNGKFYIVSKSGYYIYCTYWQCHAHKTLKTQFTVEKSGDYYTIYQAESLDQGKAAYGYLAPQTEGSGKIVYCDNAASNGYKTWSLVLNNKEENEHEYVDLGLPSGIKWATCNVGANSPEEYGDYFAWGETEPKDYYDWSTYKYCNGSPSTLTKYCVDSYRGTVDNKTTLELTDDAARVNWGDKWRMPTKAEQDELRNTSNCTWTWTTQNGVNGYKVTSVVNGNSIFLPAAGYRRYDGRNEGGSRAYYWSTLLNTSGNSEAYFLYFDLDNVAWSGSGRYYGFSVRAVCE